jgi:cell division protein FtsW (lipid II flippase)
MATSSLSSNLQNKRQSPARTTEAVLLIFVFLAGILGFGLLVTGMQVAQGQNPLAGLPTAVLPPLVIGATAFGLHALLRRRQTNAEQLILPIVALLLTIGMLMIWRLRGPAGVWQQISRGLLPGAALAAAFILKPDLLERTRRWALLIVALGVILPILTALFGEVDESGARLALKLGPLPAVQPAEVIKLTLIIFLAWYIDRHGRRVEGRARPFLGWLRLPGLHNFLPGILVVSLATLALVQMSDFGAVLVLGIIFLGMVFAGFETRIFLTISIIGVCLAVVAGLVLSFVWQVPNVIRLRFLAYQDPWSNEEIVLDGQPIGLTVSEGPGYQIQQSLNSVVAGGLTGTGLGFGKPEYVPLAHSDFIFAAIVEELGSVTGLAVLFLFILLIMRITRVALLLPSSQVYERLLLIGIGIHFFIQVIIMVGGTLNLLPLTGITIPFLSLGGMALMVNLLEIGMVFSAVQRLESPQI